MTETRLINPGSSHTIRGVFGVLQAAVFGGIATHLALSPGFSWWIVVLLSAHASYAAVNAYCSLFVGKRQSSAGWFIKGLGYILASLLLSGDVLAHEISVAWLLAAVLIFAIGLMYLKLGRALGNQDVSVGKNANAPEVPARTARIVWIAILVSHAIILVVALTGAAQVYPDGGSRLLIAFLAIWAVVTAWIAHRRWQKTSEARLTPQTYANYLIAWGLGQAISVSGLMLTVFGTTLPIWIWFPLFGVALSIIHRPRQWSAA